MVRDKKNQRCMQVAQQWDCERGTVLNSLLLSKIYTMDKAKSIIKLAKAMDSLWSVLESGHKQLVMKNRKEKI